MTIIQVLLRAVLIFVVTLCIVRIADKRFFAKKTAFDVVLGLILAIPILFWIGIVLAVIGVILLIAGSAGRPVGGRRYWY